MNGHPQKRWRVKIRIVPDGMVNEMYQAIDTDGNVRFTTYDKTPQGREMIEHIVEVNNKLLDCEEEQS